MAIEFSPTAATNFPTGGHFLSSLVATNFPTSGNACFRCFMCESLDPFGCDIYLVPRGIAGHNLSALQGSDSAAFKCRGWDRRSYQR